MEVNNILTADYLDILFRNRNKQYGAYALRRQYQYTVMKSMGTILLIAGVIFIVGMRNKTEVAAIADAITAPVELTHLELDLPKPPAPPPPPKALDALPVENIATQKFDIPKIVDDFKALPNEAPPEIKDLTNKAISDVTKAGDATTSDMAMSSTPTRKGGGGGETGGGESGASSEAFVYTEIAPAFNGSITDYMQRNLRYPEQAKEANIQGRVTVRFVVAEDGSVTNAVVLKGIGGGCDEEALRVVNRMPKWTPGRQNGKAVKVYHTMPILFKLNT